MPCHPYRSVHLANGPGDEAIVALLGVELGNESLGNTFATLGYGPQLRRSLP
jgi:hypothetical protein